MIAYEKSSQFVFSSPEMCLEKLQFELFSPSSEDKLGTSLTERIIDHLLVEKNILQQEKMAMIRALEDRVKIENSAFVFGPASLKLLKIFLNKRKYNLDKGTSIVDGFDLSCDDLSDQNIDATRTEKKNKNQLLRRTAKIKSVVDLLQKQKTKLKAVREISKGISNKTSKQSILGPHELLKARNQKNVTISPDYTPKSNLPMNEEPSFATKTIFDRFPESIMGFNPRTTEGTSSEIRTNNLIQTRKE